VKEEGRRGAARCLRTKRPVCDGLGVRVGVVGKAGLECRRARFIEAVSPLCVPERAKQGCFARSPQGRVYGGPEHRV
jgi:hypothetical protein